MPYPLGKNGYKQAEAITNWYDDPHDPGAVERVYGQSLIPFYDYPMLIRVPNNGWRCSPDVTSYAPFETQFKILADKILVLCAQLNIGVNSTDDEGNTFNTVDNFTENFLCGFNGNTRNKFANQADPDLFADIKRSIEIILNAILKDVSHAEGLLQRLIDALGVCEGGAWADLKTLAREINPTYSLFGFLEKTRENIVNNISLEHIVINQDFFNLDDNYLYETHVNIFLLHLFSMLGRLKQQPIKDAFMPRIKIYDEGNTTIAFLDEKERNIAFNLYRIPEEYLNFFPQQFDASYHFENICNTLRDHLNEQIDIIFDAYTKTITDAVRTTGLTPEAYLQTHKPHSHDLIYLSLIDAKADCRTHIGELFTSFDASAAWVTYILNDDMLNTHHVLTLKPRDERAYVCQLIAAHSLKYHDVFTGFRSQPLPSEAKTPLFLMSTQQGEIQWIENADGTLVSFYDYMADFPAYQSFLIDQAVTKSLLCMLRMALHDYRIIMADENAFQTSLDRINARYLMNPSFALEDESSPLAVAIKKKDIETIKAVLSDAPSAHTFMSPSIIQGVLNLAFTPGNAYPEFLEIMIEQLPDVRSALTPEQEKMMIDWAIAHHKFSLLCHLIRQSTELHINYTIPSVSDIHFSMLEIAAWFGQSPMVEACLARSDLLFLRPFSLFYSIRIAVMQRNAPLLGLLLKHPASMEQLAHNQHELDLMELAIKFEALECIKLLLLREDFASVLQNKHLLTLRTHFGIDKLFDLCHVSPDSLQGFQLRAQTAILRLQKRLTQVPLNLSEEARILTEQKIKALIEGIQTNQLEPVCHALALRSGLDMTWFWAKPEASKPTPSPKYGQKHI